MDRETLSNYGWIVICTLILAVVIAFATPFGNTIGNSVNDVVKMVMQNDDENDAKTVEELQEIYNFSYYSTLSKAIDDVNNSTVANADSNNSGASVGIYKSQDKFNVVILKNIEMPNSISINKNVKLNLGGHTIKFTNNTESSIIINSNVDCKIDGRLNGSRIYKEYDDATISTRLIYTCGNLTVDGGKYELYSTYKNVVNSIKITSIIYQWKTTSNTKINDCSILLKSQYNINSNQAIGIYIANGKFDTNNSAINIDVGNNTDYGTVRGIKNQSGSIKINSSKINIFGNNQFIYGVENRKSLVINDSQIATSTENIMDTQGYGIYNYGGTLTFNSGSVIGNNAALKLDNASVSSSIKLSKIYINGGTFASYCNEAIRFSLGTDDIAYIQNATIKCTDYAAFSVCETSNSSTYINNCKLVGGQYAFTFEDSNGETGNEIYICNTNIEENKKIKNDSGNKLYIGKNTNITNSSIEGSGEISFISFDTIPF